MRRELFTIPLEWLGLGNIPVFSYGFMMMTAFAAAIFMALRRAKRDGIHPDAVYDVSLICIVSGIVGARLMWLFQEVDEPLSLPFSELFAVWRGGLVFYGGMILSFACGSFYVWKKKLPVGLLTDCFAPGMAAGIGFGRIGCFLNGCCFGAVCPLDNPLGIVFPAGSPAALHQFGEGGFLRAAAPIYPTQLLESAAGFVIFAVILLTFNRRRYPGQMALMFLKLYAIVRFSVEFLRDDTALYFAHGGFPGLKSGQIVAIVTFAFACWLSRRLDRRQAHNHSVGKETA